MWRGQEWGWPRVRRRSGGVGRLSGVFAGALLLSSINTAINIIGLEPQYMQVIRGGLMLVAVQALSVPPLVGLWDFAGVAGYATGPVDAVPVYLTPATSAAIVAHLDTSGISLAGGTRSWA